jgi:hypothetical protein
MPENYAEGHPLRKDFPLRGRFSRAEQTRQALAMPVEDYYTPDELALGRKPAATPERAGAETAVADDAVETPGRPNVAEGWSQGASGSASGNVPGPKGAGA